MRDKQLSKIIKVQSSSDITKCDRSLLQSASGITKCDRSLLQSASGITKCDRLLLQSASGIQSVTGCYYKVRQILQSVTVLTKWDVTEESNLPISPEAFNLLPELFSIFHGLITEIAVDKNIGTF